MDTKKVVFLFLTILWLGGGNGFVYSQEIPGQIAMIVAKGNFRDEELLVPKDIFEEAGYKVIIFSSSPGKVKGILGAVVNVDKTIDEFNSAEYDTVIFVGGPGASEYWDNPRAHRIVRDTLANNKVLGAICIAPVTLAKAGVLRDKKATVWQSEKGKLQQEGAIYTGADVEVSGKIVTASGPRSAERFAETILSLLK